MLGTIIGLDENIVILKLNEGDHQNLINLYVMIKDSEKICIGEIISVKDGLAQINLLGEIVNKKFMYGVIRKPGFDGKVQLVPKENIDVIIGMEDYKEYKDLYLGKSPIYEGVNLGVNINDFFSNHFSIFGSTGSGKSCSVSRIFQNLFKKTEYVPYNSSILIFDAYGEYHSAFKEINTKNKHINFKAYTTNLSITEADKLSLPLWLLGVDDLALLLGADSVAQLPIIEKALKLVTVFAQDEEKVIKNKNDIIARAILDILASGSPPAQIRDQIFSVLSTYKTKQLNLETEIFQPGYVRPLKQCLLIDASGKIREMELLTNFMNNFLEDDLELQLPDGTFMYTLKDLKEAFDFALISEGSLNSDKIYDQDNILRVRLHALLNSDASSYFNYPKFISRDNYIKELISMPDGSKAQIINFNINYIDDRLAKNITKIYSKLLFDFSKDGVGRNLPFHIILEEAHRYVQNDKDIDILGYNIFDRITKEGRKYGVILGLITQRPSELSETALSQCTNFLIFKMLHPKDVNYIKEMVPNITTEVIKKLKILRPGTCIAFGLGFKVPVIVKFEMPDPSPSSASCDVSNVWFKKVN